MGGDNNERRTKFFFDSQTFKIFYQGQKFAGKCTVFLKSIFAWLMFSQKTMKVSNLLPSKIHHFHIHDLLVYPEFVLSSWYAAFILAERYFKNINSR